MYTQMLAFTYKYHNIPTQLIRERFQINFSPIRRPLLPWKDEVNNTARLIAASTTKPLYVFMSGGIDSEVVARAFLENNIPFTAITAKHTNGTNMHDTRFADDFCKKYNIKQEIVEVDMSNFDTIIENYIEQGYRATNIYHYLQLILLERAEELGGFGVGGAGEQLYYTKDNEIHIKINSCYTLGMDWCKRNNTWHQFWFNLTTPEIYAAYMQIDIIKTLLQNPEYFVNHHFASIEKRMVLHRFWPDMVRRTKFSGFEKIEDSYRQPKQAELSCRFPDIGDLFIPISKIQQQLKINDF